MNDNNLQQIGNAIKEHQYEGNWGSDLEFDPATGEFKQVPKGTGTGDGVMIMEDGFAIAGNTKNRT